jgi:uncharacterized protein YecT (DUF1311 family)
MLKKLPIFLLMILPAAVIGTKMSHAEIMAQQGIKCNPNGNTIEMRKCATDEYQNQDRKLNQAYQKLLSQLEGERKQKLVIAQRAWINFRDKNCSFVSSESSGGTLEPLIYTGCLSELTKKRTEDLNSYVSKQKDKNQAKMPQFGIVKSLTTGDLMCYSEIVDKDGQKHDIGATFEICEGSSKYLNKKVRLTYGEIKINDCESSEPCGKTRKETVITGMTVLTK